MRFIQRVAVAALMAGIAATTAANGAEPSPLIEEAATADLNRKIADDNVALDASEKAKQEAYEQQVKQQQAQYEQQKADYARQVEEQKVAYQRQLEEQKAAHQRELEQYEQQVKSAAINQAPSPAP
jgi:flagellar basal body-associated protein FliL